MDRIDLLRIFLRVAATGSFSQAADQLALPRPTVSLAVQQLEARLGTRLLHRTTRKVALTLDGQALVDRASSLVNDMQDWSSASARSRMRWRGACASMCPAAWHA